LKFCGNFVEEPVALFQFSISEAETNPQNDSEYGGNVMEESKFIKGVQKTSAILFKMEDFLTSATFCAMLALIVVQVFVRFCLTTPLAWTEELTRTFFLISSFFGGAACVKTRSNVEINLLASVIKRISKGRRHQEVLLTHAFDMAASLIGVLFSIVITYFMWTYTLDLKHQGQISIALEYPLFWVTSTISVALALMGIHYLFHFIESAYIVAAQGGKKEDCEQ